MFYWLFYEKLFRLYSPFREFQYYTFRTAMASLTALFLSLALGPWMIARLRRFQIGQFIREDGPKSHQKKAGTPTMGGLLICTSIIVPTLLWANLRVPALWVALAGVICFGAVGFMDDYSKVTRKRNLGLTAREKLMLQIAAGTVIGALLLLMSSHGQYTTNLRIFRLRRISNRIC